MEQSTLAIIIIGLAIISFAWEKIPLAVTAMIASLAMGITGIIKFSDVYSGYASTVTMMVGGMIIVGNSLFETGLAKVLGAKLVKLPIVNNERLFLFVIVVMTSFLSAFLSNSATVAMFIPIIGAAVMRSGGKLTNKNLVMGAGLGAAMGGAGTMVGSTAQLIGQSVLMKTAGCRPLGFFELSYLVGPLCVIMAIYLVTVGYKIQQKAFDFEDPTMDPNELSAIENEGNEKMTWQMYLSGAVMLACVAGFVFKVWNVGIIALVGCAILMGTKCIDFKKSMRDLDWNTLVILSAAQGFAKGLDVSGGGRVIANFILNVFGGQDASAYALLVVAVILSTVLTNFMSNTAVVAMLAPIFVPLALALHVSPETFVIGVIIGASTALATPIGTPCVTQTLVAGYRYMDYVKVGLPINIILTIVTCILLPIIYGF
jgi:anion transporter